jgi:hypothetical protein
MDICGEAVIGFVCTHGDAFEFLELAEEVFSFPFPRGRRHLFPERSFSAASSSMASPQSATDAHSLGRKREKANSSYYERTQHGDADNE